jgi:hypothetical protein
MVLTVLFKGVCLVISLILIVKLAATYVQLFLMEVIVKNSKRIVLFIKIKMNVLILRTDDVFGTVNHVNK